MLTDYLILTSATATLALIWRALLLDHSRFLARVESLPIVGGALRCGFCASVWLALFAVALHNPLAAWAAEHPPLLGFVASWLSVGAGVLLLRNVIAALMEGTGVLTHLHRQGEGH